MLYFIVLSLFYTGQADLPPSFYQHEKKVESRRKERLKDAKSKKNIREKKEAERARQAEKYKKIREKKIKEKLKRAEKFKAMESQIDKNEERRARMAAKSAKLKRKKKSLNWKEQNREFGIKSN